MTVRTKVVVVALALALLVALGAATPSGAQDSKSAKKVLRVGWAQDPGTLNPFVGQDEEDYTVWAIDWDLLVNFSPKNLGPAPGIAQSWTVSPDKRTVTFKLVKGAKWSDGQPITSADVKYSLQTLGSNGALFTSYTQNVASIETPDAETVIVHTKRPDARIVGGLFIYILPQHVWGKVPVKKLLGSFNPDLPLVGSGPYVVSQFQRGRFLRMVRNPYFRGPKPKFDEIQFIKYGTPDAAERALRVGEVDVEPEVQASSFANLGKAADVTTVKASSASFTQLSFNSCPKTICPDAKFNPAVQDPAVRQAVAYAVDRNRINIIANRGTSFIGHGLLGPFYQSFYAKPAQDYPFDPNKANQLLDAAGYTRQGNGIRAKGSTKLSFNLYVRSESPPNIQVAKLVAEMARKVGIEFKVQVVSADKLTELTTQKKNGKMAPDYDTFIWGWGGDPYDPSFLLGLMTTAQIGDSSDSFYSNPEYDQLFTQQAGEFDTTARKALIGKMIALLQRDLPYLVLSQDPNLQAYRSDRIKNVKLSCPQTGGGDLFCEQTSYAPLLTLAPGTGGGGGGGGSGIAIVIGIAVLAAIALLVARLRRRRAAKAPLEIES